MIFCVFKDFDELLLCFYAVHSEMPLGHVGPCIIWQMEALIEILSFVTNHYAISMQLNVYNIDTCHKNNGLNLYILKLVYLIYLHRVL